ncbi:BatD family protein [Rehaibacterium terrae]|jgi:hypothetical protein|uniref:Protein BatD n=1 Tax=Rehaibacterium terrae TaxID=1341696 RepID=A0A7W7Y0Z3_9GAMM|nr:BatD family protein [Rehaibacterium terrae]MBB5016086.1 hypothetical protein [Rehaibacterium terrae]
MKRSLFPTLSLALACLLLSIDATGATPRAWLDRDRIELGETVTLNIEVTDSMARPDFSPLAADFDIRGSSSRSEASIANGRAVTRALWAVALEPRRIGELTIPPIAVGSDRTAPLTLTVTAPRPRSAAAGDPVFLETEIETTTPYVQQAVVYTVRLHYTVTLLEGQLDAPEPAGAVLRRLGEDSNYVRVLDGIRYTVVERRYVLIPERSGALELPPARFRGRTLGGAGSRFGTGQILNALGEPFVLEVRPRPPAAARPWLPARRIELRFEDAPDTARAGEPFTLTVRAEAEGITAEQFPEIALPAIDGVQIYPEAPAVRERVRDGRPVVEWTRRFAVVAARPGTLAIPAFGIDWWDVEHDRAARAELPALRIALQPGIGVPVATHAPPTAAVPAAEPTDAPRTDAPASAIGLPWPWLTAGLAALWLATLVWGWRRGRATVSASRSRDAGAASPSRPPPVLRRALAQGDLPAITEALLTAAPPPRPHGLTALAERLCDPAQAEAVRALDAARWGGGDGEVALARLREAFRRPPAFAAPAGRMSGEAALPPHYPAHRRGE